MDAPQPRVQSTMNEPRAETRVEARPQPLLTLPEAPADGLLAGLNDAQRQAVTAAGGPVVVLAGAGSGKTRVLTRRIARRILDDETDPRRVLALTFTRKAAAELRHRLAGLGLRDGIQAGTFHAVALLQLRERWVDRGIVPPTLLKGKTRLVASLLSTTRSRSDRSGSRTLALDVVAEIDWARARLIDPDDYPTVAAANGRTPPVAAERITDLLGRYAQEKQRRRVVDFDDLLELALRDLRRDPSFAAAIRWRYRHLYVDELQDVNPLQFALLEQWRGESDDLFVVGDPNQAIYGWNGSDPQLLATFARREPAATVIELRENHRSTPQILAVAAATIEARALDATRADGPAPTITAYADAEAEAIGIARRVAQAHAEGARWSDQAVLARTNAQLPTIERALLDAGIPVHLRSESGPLTAPEVRTELKLLVDAPELVAAYDDLVAQLDADPDGPSSVAAIERRANLAALVRLVGEYLAVEITPSGAGLAAWLETVRVDDVDGETDAVELASFHAAKGLEWEVVHIAGLEDGFVPVAYATTGGQLAEERRLLYVAITRARTELHLSWARQRTFTTRPIDRSPSPLLGPVAEAVDRLGVAPLHRVDWRAKLAESRRSLDAGIVNAGAEPAARSRRGPQSVQPGRRARPRRRGAARAPDPLSEALVEWRARKARAADVAHHAVLSDHALRTIAATRPTTRGKLAEVGGLGPAKLARYGEELLGLIAHHTASPG